MNQTRVEWQTASPLWEEALKDKKNKVRFQQPVILRFATDTFMEDLGKLLEKNASQLKDVVVRHETWEEEGAGWLTEDELAREKTPLKLFQPAHGRFYLAAASLVCRIPGLPDKCIYSDQDEKVSFVLRRLVLEQKKYVEYGWNNETGWKKVDSFGPVPDDEERLPMFAMNYPARDRQRRLLVGFIPVSSRETFQAPAKLNPLRLSKEERQQAKKENDPMADPRMVRFQNLVLGAAEGLENRAKITDSRYKMTDEEARDVLLFIVLDFADHLHRYLPGVWKALQQKTGTGLKIDEKKLFDWLTDTSTRKFNWNEALLNVYKEKENILSGTGDNPAATIPAIVNLKVNKIKNIVVDVTGGSSAGLENLMEKALGEYTEEDAAREQVLEISKHEPGVYYIVRCIYERPRCKGVHAPVVSQSSRRFQLAPFFEPEAPARPVRITLPENTGISGLRKFKKNVSVLFSDKLRNQMERIKDAKLGDLDDGNISEGSGFSLGMICSLSIPIITICAMILLMIIVKLLNIIFWWMPFFKICFPIIKPKE